MTKQTHYPSYDVLEHKNTWDDHTQSIVTARLVREKDYRFLTLTEAEVLRSWCMRLVDDGRAEIIQYTLCHIDQTLMENLGEGQRKDKVPNARMLIRTGISAVEAMAQRQQLKHFFHLPSDEQHRIMQAISEGTAGPKDIWGDLPQKELFLKLMTLTYEAYFSHPTVWSEIGYGGPAYPRGYLRTEGKHLDPWEAKREDD